MAAMRRNFGRRHRHLINVRTGYGLVLKDFCLLFFFFSSFLHEEKAAIKQAVFFSLPLFSKQLSSFLWKKDGRTKWGKSNSS